MCGCAPHVAELSRSFSFFLFFVVVNFCCPDFPQKLSIDRSEFHCHGPPSLALSLDAKGIVARDVGVLGDALATNTTLSWLR